MYTPHEGPDFLRAYIIQRQELRDQLRTNRYKLLSEDSTEAALAKEIHDAILGDSTDADISPLRERTLEVLPAQPGTGEFATPSLLLDLWQVFLYNSERAAQICPAWVEFLMKKFEVFKRLYVGYTPVLKPSKKDYQRLDNYALLASLLMYLYRQKSNLRYLNATLKMIDLLASVGVGQEGALTQITLLAAVELELVAIDKLFVEQRITL